METENATYHLIEEHNAILDELVTIEKAIKTMQSKSKQYIKKIKKKLEHYDKLLMKKKKKKYSVNRIKSGINKESQISDELCKFLKIKEKTLIARTEATTVINKYIKDNELQKIDNKRIICLDKTLSDLFKLPLAKEITFFDLPKYMNHHFIKTSS